MARFSLKDRIRSFRYAFGGLWHAVRTQLHFRIHLAAAALVVAAGLYFGVTATEWIILVICIGLVMAAELFNTSVEMLTDLLHPQRHPKAGLVKDLAAAAVLVTAIAAAITGLIIFIPYISERWG